MGAPSFDIPARPERHFSGTGGLEYRGGTVFELAPEADSDLDDSDLDYSNLDDSDLVEFVTTVLAAGPYRFGDFHELPMPLWLVRDRETGDAFRVAVRSCEVRLHVLPRTDAAGLRAFYDRLDTVTGTDLDWQVRTRSRE